MANLEARGFDAPDESRSFDRGRMDVIKLGSGTIGRAVFEPGWRWSECVKPIAGTESCEVAHLGYVISGRLRIRMNDGTEGEAGPGEVFDIAPGHDGWVVGDEPCIALDFQGAPDYAR